MTGSEKSVLLISPDASVADAVKRILHDVDGAKLRTEKSSLLSLNGHARELAADTDIIIVDAGTYGGADIEAIRVLASDRRAGAKLFAVADGDMTLSQVRALNSVGVDEVLPSPLSASDLTRHFLAPGHSAATAVPVLREPGKLIAVAKARGGVGATTIAVNLADELVGHKAFMRKYTPHKVVLVDLDVQFGSAGSMLDLEESDALMQLALDGAMPDDRFLSDALMRTANGLAVLPAPSKFMPLDSLTAVQISRLLDLLRRDYDFVIVDLPHALGSWIEPVLKQTSELMIVSDISVPSIRHSRRLIDFFVDDNPDLKIRVVINHESRGVFTSSVQKEAQKALDRKLDFWLPHDPKAARNSADRGQPLSSVAPNSQLGKAISRLTRATLADLTASPHAHIHQKN